MSVELSDHSKRVGPATPGRTPAVVLVLVAATFVVILNETIMINAIPRLMVGLEVSEQTAQWVSTAFMLAMAAVIPVTGWLLQRVSTRRAYATAMGVFLAGTALAAAAPVFEVLLVGRIVQAAGTAVMMPLLMTTLMTVVAEGGAGRSAAIVVVALAIIAAFVARQLVLQRNGTPLMDLRTLLHPTYTKALILISVSFMTLLGSAILLPLFLQNLRELTPLQTGLLVMPGGLAMGLLGPTVGRIFDRLGGRVLVIPGSLGIVISLAGFTLVSMTMPYWQVLGLHVLLMLSLAAVFTPVFTLGLGDLPTHLYSHGSSMLGTLQQVAAAFGTAAAVTVMSVRTDQLMNDGVGERVAQLAGMKLAFAVAAIAALVVVAIAFQLPRRQSPKPQDMPGDEVSDLELVR